jgi:hypothetical protein
VQHLILADQLDQVALEGGRGAFDAGGIDGIAARRACGPNTRDLRHAGFDEAVTWGLLWFEGWRGSW